MRTEVVATRGTALALCRLVPETGDGMQSAMLGVVESSAAGMLAFGRLFDAEATGDAVTEPERRGHDLIE